MNKRTALALALAIVTMAASVYGAITAFTNTYEKPIREAEKIANAKPDDYDYESVMSGAYGGLGRSELLTIAKVVQTSAAFTGDPDTPSASFSTMIASRDAQYGEDSTVRYEVQSKEDLPISELKKAKDSLTAQGERLIHLGDFFASLDETQAAEITAAMDINPDDFAKLISALQRLGKEITGAQVSAGYRLQLTRTIVDENGEVLDSADMEVTILNVNNQWIAYDYRTAAASCWTKTLTSPPPRAPASSSSFRTSEPKNCLRTKVRRQFVWIGAFWYLGDCCAQSCSLIARMHSGQMLRPL